MEHTGRWFIFSYFQISTAYFSASYNSEHAMCCVRTEDPNADDSWCSQRGFDRGKGGTEDAHKDEDMLTQTVQKINPKHSRGGNVGRLYSDGTGI